MKTPLDEFRIDFVIGDSHGETLGILHEQGPLDETFGDLPSDLHGAQTVIISTPWRSQTQTREKLFGLDASVSNGYRALSRQGSRLSTGAWTKLNDEDHGDREYDSPVHERHETFLCAAAA
jgi:hypothetical protein